MTRTPAFDAALAAAPAEDDTMLDDLSAFNDYASMEYASQLNTVANALSTDLPDFSLTLNTDDYGTHSADVGIFFTCGGVVRYLTENIDLKHTTTDRSATGTAQASAIRDALVASYDATRAYAQAAGLIPTDEPAETPTDVPTVTATYSERYRSDRTYALTDDLLDRAAEEGYERTPDGVREFIEDDGDVSDLIPLDTRNECVACDCLETTLD